MYKCQICQKEFKKRISLERHITVSYGKNPSSGHLPKLVYENRHEGRSQFSKKNLKKMYCNDKMTTRDMAELLSVDRGLLLRTMHYYGIHLRTRSEATKIQISRDGLWNKGKTKYTHPGVLKYANSRRGKNNPYYKTEGFAEREKRFHRHLLKINKLSIGKHSPKTTEVRMEKILKQNSIAYIKQFYLSFKKTWRIYDFLINNNFIIEMQGNYFHANPKFFKSEDIIKVGRRKRKAIEIWKYDQEKRIFVEQMGYIFLAIWESDFTIMSDTEIINLLRGYL